MRPVSLVTGATGIVGSHIARALEQSGHAVRVLVRPGSDQRALSDISADVVEGDVMRPDSVLAAAQGCTWVFHAAAVFAYDGDRAHAQAELAVQGTRHVLHAAQQAGVRRVVVTSSSVTLGSTSSPQVLDESAVFADPQPAAYVTSKVRQEAVAFEAARELGLEVLAVCPTLVMGARDYRLGPSNASLANYLNDPLRSTFLGGCNVVNAEDLARAHLLVAQHGTPGQRYVAGGENLRWEALHALVSELTGTFGPALRLNHTAAYLAAAYVEAAARFAGRRPFVSRDEARMACRFYWYSSARLQALGWTARPARAVLSEALAWVIDRGHIADSVRSRLKLCPELEARHS
ncbi:MAG: NAD-dependent epimerase/dehydratase family protein [Roseateles sp.]|nr:MAG: NAD-dependent epimerase/dehydratase family protein [Roseateles sp.]